MEETKMSIAGINGYIIQIIIQEQKETLRKRTV